MKNLLSKTIFAMLFLTFAFGCQKDLLEEPTMMDDVSLKNAVVLDCPVEYSLKAGQDILVGTLTVGINGDKLVVTFHTWGSWFMSNTKLCIVTDPNDFPLTKKGNPKVGHFPVNEDWPDLTQSATYEFDLGTGRIYIAAHADVELVSDCETVQCETAWGYDCDGNCVEFPGASWGWYLMYDICAIVAAE